MSQISKKVRDAVRSRLSDSTNGFNAKLSAVASQYGLTPFTVDWTTSSKQLFEARAHPSDLEKSTPSKYPLVTLYVLRARNTRENKPQLFSGFIDVVLDFHVTARGVVASALKTLQDTADAIEDAVFASLDPFSWTGAYTPPVALVGGPDLEREPVEMDGENWRQTLSFMLTFQVDTN